jgi:uncharacterized sporulation protein YeaH/YhbH (DUF444 family)
MVTIVDRSKTNTNKSAKNRKRFIERNKAAIKNAIADQFKRVKLTDVETNKGINVEVDTNEYTFATDPNTGEHDMVIPGNPGVYKGDEIYRPRGGSSNQAGRGEAEDEFTFILNDKEYRDILFEYLELPDFVKKTLNNTEVFKMQQAGYSTNGLPSQLSISKSYLNSYGRRIAFKAALDAKILETEDEEEKKRLEEEKTKIPWFDDLDLRYKNFEQQPLPITAAVMICIMDVSGSMTSDLKTRAKKFFYLLHLFLKAKYAKTEIVFITHTDTPEEVDEKTFFYSRRSGGTEIKPALELAAKIIKDRYNPEKYNVYVAQASDGDSFGNDAQDSAAFIKSKLVSIIQYFAYLELPYNGDYQMYGGSMGRDLFGSDYFMELAKLELKKVQVKSAKKDSDVFDVFVELFKKK